MLISREELQREWLVLKDYGLTDEEVKGMMEFFDYEVAVPPSKMRRLINKTKKFLGVKNV
ncbi:MAG: hypothetical protein ACWGQW_06270 [bacterium]